MDVAIQEVPAATWPRASTPPAWGVLEPTALAERRTDAAVAGRPGRLRAVAAPPRDGRCPMTWSRIPGVRFGTIERHADERGAFRELWRTSTVGRIDPPTPAPRRATAPLLSRATSRARGPASFAASISIDGRSTAGSSVSGRAFVALVERGRCSMVARRRWSRRASSGRTTGSRSRRGWRTGSWRSSRWNSSTS